MTAAFRRVVSAGIGTYQSLRTRTRRFVHGARLGKLLAAKDPAHESYLRLQLARSLAKDDGLLPPRARRLIDAVTSHLQNGESRILCIGCRNTAELDCFLDQGFRHVTGIDLFSPRADIQVMDMHAMSFPSDSFDLVYASHSLEHALEPARVIGEITRVAKPGAIVAIEVPLDFALTSADLVDYRSIEGLLAPFGSAVGSVLWSETRPAGATDGSGTPIGRVIFRIAKSLR
jgi:SAM-dependent methyltransferase